MDGTAQKACVVVVRGRVQRVGFRAFVEYTAADRRIAGWVRNRKDGSVEALFMGDAAAVDAMIEDCRRGPSSARVEAVEQRPATAAELGLRNASQAFSVLGTV